MSPSLIKAALALAIVISAAACKSGKDPDAASGTMSFDWSQRSADGSVELRQRRESRGAESTCRVQALTVPGAKVIWSGTACLPVPSGLVFISKGGEKLVVLDLFPSAGVQSPNWNQVSLAQLWNRGKIEREYKGAEILAADRAADMRRSYSWLRGEADEAVRESARAVADGTQISMDLADGRTITLGFDGAALPTPPSVSPAARPAEVAVAPEPQPAALPAREEPPPPPPAQPGGLIDGELYRWQDESGATHFATGGQVPARYAKVARPVQGQVGVVPMDLPDAAPQSGQAGQPQPQPGQPGQPGQAARTVPTVEQVAQPAAPQPEPPPRPR